VTRQTDNWIALLDNQPPLPAPQPQQAEANHRCKHAADLEDLGADEAKQAVAWSEWPQRTYVGVHYRVKHGMRDAAQQTADNCRPDRQFGRHGRCRVGWKEAIQDWAAGEYRARGQEPDRRRADERMKLAVNWPISPDQVIKRFNVNEDLSDREGDERHASWGGGFRQEPRPEVEWREGHRFALLSLVV
jgi:hypothetical protein